MKIKVCGMKQPGNITEIVALQPDFIGFIFYEKSPRYINTPDVEMLGNIPAHIIKTGVFVNEEIEKILQTAKHYRLNAIQLHGNEKPEMCQTIKDNGLICIKAFSIANEADFTKLNDYEGVADYYLFDTKTNAFGGSGEKFNWQLLHHYQLNTPFLLSGGIGPYDADEIKKINHPNMIGIDINSCFEIAPGVKDSIKVKNLLKQLRIESNQT